RRHRAQDRGRHRGGVRTAARAAVDGLPAAVVGVGPGQPVPAEQRGPVHGLGPTGRAHAVAVGGTRRLRLLRRRGDGLGRDHDQASGRLMSSREWRGWWETLRSLTARHPLAADAALAAVLLVPAGPQLSRFAANPALLPLVLALAVPLVWRRRA